MASTQLQSVDTAPPLAIVPDTAPFNEQQRAWLNGFLAGWLGLQQSADSGLNMEASTQHAVEAAPGEPADDRETDDEDFPWHEPSIPLEQRLEMAAARPHKRKLMAAMAQLDCGACGYLCKTYSEAIASGAESDLTLCSPGGRATTKALKQLIKEAGTSDESDAGSAAPAESTKTVASAVSAGRSGTVPTGHSRENPYDATLRVAVQLNKPGSEKVTTHVELDLSGSGIVYRAGDSLGVYPTNCTQLVEQVIELTGLEAVSEVTLSDGRTTTFEQALSDHCDLRQVDDELLEHLLAADLPAASAEWIRRALDETINVDDYDLLDILEQCRPLPIDATSLVKLLLPLKPRLYSISSSPERFPQTVHLTIARASVEVRGRQRKGVCSTMFADRLQPGMKVPVYVHPTHDFLLPDNPDADLIMIGPGTGIAPFRAFLQQREARADQGRNWLLFGNPHRATDFLYEAELQHWESTGLLTRIDTAFSRDQAEKVYVQHRLLEHGAEVHRWLHDGAYLYVCGDAKRMAVDVDAALRMVVQQHGAMTAEAAERFVIELARSGRYRRDVY